MTRQNTFVIIPAPAGMRLPNDVDDDSSNSINNMTTSTVRPMTSRQIRKAHMEATRAPHMSRAKQMEWERAEQARIRRELNQDRAAARARAARQRKKEAEEKRREERRRDGLPPVSARPSQNTIARFFRGNGSAKKRDVAGDVVVEAATTAAVAAAAAAAAVAADDEVLSSDDEAGLLVQKQQQHDDGTKHKEVKESISRDQRLEKKPARQEMKKVATPQEPNLIPSPGSDLEDLASLFEQQTPKIGLMCQQRCPPPSGQLQTPLPLSSPTATTERFFTSSGSREKVVPTELRTHRRVELKERREVENQRQEAARLRLPTLAQVRDVNDAITSPSRKKAFSSSGKETMTSLQNLQGGGNFPRVIVGAKMRCGGRRAGLISDSKTLVSDVVSLRSAPDKENVRPLAPKERGSCGDSGQDGGVLDGCSQETDYGGDWVEDVARDLAL